MRNRLFLKILVGHLLFLLILTAVSFISYYQVIRFSQRNELSAILGDLCVTTAKVVSPFIETDPMRLEEAVKGISVRPDKRIVILDTQGTVLADTADDPTTLRDLATSREFINSLNGLVGTYLDTYAVDDKKMLSASAPIKRGDSTIGVVIISVPFTVGIASISPLVIISLFLFILLVAVLGAVVLSARLSTPIEELGDAAKRVGRGDFSVRVFLDRNDELKELADRFNYMTERIGSLFHQTSQQKDELLQIITSIEEGLLVTDRNDRIILFNESLSRITHDRSAPGKYYWELIRDPKVAGLIEGIKRNRRNRHDEIEIGGRSYTCGGAYIDSKDEIVIIFHDITDMKSLAAMKKEFVTNVSHELRTPLTAIKGFSETLETAEDTKRPYYIEIIKRNTDRMISIIKDLLALSELEEADTPLEVQGFDAEEMLRTIISIFEKTVHEKRLALSLTVDNGPLIIWADPFRLEQMFINLIDNAVKYTERGKIAIGLSLRDKVFTAEVSDTGIGIPEDDIPKIFDRFYRIDKSRSRRLGGTGLGLSIVKHIVLLHNGDITVQSDLGVGSRFTVRLPQSGLGAAHCGS